VHVSVVIIVSFTVCLNYEIWHCQVFFALVLATIGISQTSAMGSDSAKARDSAISIFEIVDRKSKIDPSSEEGQVLENVRGDVELQHVSFRYPTRPDVQIFTNLCLSISSGKVHILTSLSCILSFFGTASNTTFKQENSNTFVKYEQL
jgi:ABC-type multidrug transport system fused ATPase/permease subunit